MMVQQHATVVQITCHSGTKITYHCNPAQTANAFFNSHEMIEDFTATILVTECLNTEREGERERGRE